MSAAEPPAPEQGELLRHARALLIRTMTAYRDDPRTSGWLRERLERLDGPLRLAVTGRVKSGRSTLINALVGAEIAPSDAEEGTQVNTVYRYGDEPRILVHTPRGAVQNVPTTSLDPATIRDLQRWRPDEVSRLVIESPSPGLGAITLIETPGVSSTAVKETGRSALAQVLSEADAVLYLTRHPHQTDIQFLRSVHELRIARRAPINTIVALSRADEVASGGADALSAADTIARRYRDEPKLRTFAQYVIPVVGLLGQAAATLTADDVNTLIALTQLPDGQLDELLLSTDRFANSAVPESVPTPVRQDLLQRVGRYGIERATSLLMQGHGVTNGAGDLKKLRSALLDESRLGDLQEAIHLQFIERHEALRARSALMAVDMVLRANPRSGSHQLLGELERLLANAHEWDELRMLSALRSGQLTLPEGTQRDAEQLLGAFGDSARSRLGLGAEATDTEIADRAGDALTRWRELATNPLHDRVRREAVSTVLRSCERLIARDVRG